MLKISFNNFQNPLRKLSGLDNLERSRPALKASIVVDFRTRSGSWFQYSITLLLKGSCTERTMRSDIKITSSISCIHPKHIVTIVRKTVDYLSL